MKKLFGAVVALLVAVSPLVASAHQSDDGDLELSVVKAPVAPDGTTAGAVLDFVVNFADPDPEVPGIGMQAGGSITVTLDPAFDLTGDQISHPGGFPPPPPVIILQGWPQSPRILPTPYTTEIVDNTITLTLLDDWDVVTFGPGPKALHILLQASSNPPEPGRYSVDVAIQPDLASEVLEGHGRVEIISKVRPSVNVVSVFSGPPGPPPPFFNPLYQELALGESGRQVGMYLWARGGDPAGDVSIEMENPRRGRLVQEGETVGTVRVEVPRGAHDQTLTHAPSFAALAAVTEIPTRVLVTTFTPDPAVAGEYTVTFEMNGGNSQTIHYDVSGP